MRKSKTREIKAKLNYGFDDGRRKVHETSRRHNLLSG
jgi:hypothetical protein